MKKVEQDHEATHWLPLVRHYLKDLVYGANDGIITTFAVASGVAGSALDPRIVLILGFANLLGDGFSMGASNFLALRSEDAARVAARRDPIEPYPVRHAVVTFLSFVVFGMVPMVSYVLFAGEGVFLTAIAVTLATLFAVGAARALVIDTHWLRAGLEMLAVGALAATVAYLVGALVSGLTGAA